MSAEDDQIVMVTVCDACLTESCWQGEFMCDEAQTAGTVEISKFADEFQRSGRGGL